MLQARQRRDREQAAALQADAVARRAQAGLLHQHQALLQVVQALRKFGSRGQTIAHAIAGMVVLDSTGTGASAGLGTMLFKYWFVMPLSHSTTICLVINAYLIVQSSSAAGSGTRTVEDRLCNVVVAFRQERARKTVGI